MSIRTGLLANITASSAASSFGPAAATRTELIKCYDRRVNGNNLELQQRSYDSPALIAEKAAR